ncbi:SDR family NAD(P)-dependent oxidoreductase [Streptomyces sp. 205]|uniref:SDR family NAD(P)-dependent oxidoreductase n=2 Tax=Streptomyces coffeae TaxID=621382 RepID=A0ABS1NQJ5_9ACTN|nr:SDR family NAD(P)-dependent oxidoreductase [Streptomyces coffeae]
MLSTWRKRQQERSALSAWRYGVVWRPVSVPASGRLSGTWLMAAPQRMAAAQDGLVEQCVRALEAAGAQVTVLTVDPTEGREALAGRIREASPVGVVSLLAWAETATEVTATDATATEATATEGTATEGIAPDAHTGESTTAREAHTVGSAPEAESARARTGAETPDPQSAGGASVPIATAMTLALVQALSDAEAEAPLWCVTSSAVSVGAGDQLTNPVQAQLWGLGRTVALEQPRSWGGLVDLPEETGQQLLTRLVAVFATGRQDTYEDQVAVRPSGVHAARLTRDTAPENGEGWQPHGTVLVTGGTGALGRHVARRLASQGAERLVLVSRQGPQAPGAERLRQELAESGAEVEVVACDITDRRALAALLDTVSAHAPLTAVVHTAGVLDDGLVTDLTPRRMARVVRVKAEAAWHLHELTAHLELDAFVLFSSIAGVFGGQGQAAYAAGNAFLDAVAQHRRGLGLPATSVAWGPWGGDGMAADAAAEQRFRLSGVRRLPPERAVAALGQVLGDGRTCVAVMDVDWERYVTSLRYAGRRSALIADLPEAAAAPAAATDVGGEEADALILRLRDLSPSEREEALLDLVQSHVAAVLGHESAAAIDADRAFKDLGFDSLTAVDLRNGLTSATGLRLSATIAFDHPTPTSLARYMRGELFPDVDDADTGSIDRGGDPGLVMDEEQLRRRLASVSLARLREAGLMDALMKLVASDEDGTGRDGTGRDEAAEEDRSIAELSVDDLVELALGDDDPFEQE